MTTTRVATEKTELILQHGWGFQASSWEQWRSLGRSIFQTAYEVKLLDRRYFRDPKSASCLNDEPDAGDPPCLNDEPGSEDDSSSNTARERKAGEAKRGPERRQQNRLIPPLESDCKSSPALKGKSCLKQPRRVVIVHSLGLHILPEEFFQTDILVCIACFKQFHPDESVAERLSRRSIERMLKKLDTAPMQVLNDFYTACGLTPQHSPLRTSPDSLSPEHAHLRTSPDSPSPEHAHLRTSPDSLSPEHAPLRTSPDSLSPEHAPLRASPDSPSSEIELAASLLKQDLQLLSENKFDERKVPPETRVLLLHGESDSIVSLKKSQELHEVFVDSKLVIVPQQGHALPFTAPDKCLEQIAEFIQNG